MKTYSSEGGVESYSFFSSIFFLFGYSSLYLFSVFFPSIVYVSLAECADFVVFRTPIEKYESESVGFEIQKPRILAAQIEVVPARPVEPIEVVPAKPVSPEDEVSFDPSKQVVDAKPVEPNSDSEGGEEFDTREDRSFLENLEHHAEQRATASWKTGWPEENFPNNPTLSNRSETPEGFLLETANTKGFFLSLLCELPSIFLAFLVVCFFYQSTKRILAASVLGYAFGWRMYSLVKWKGGILPLVWDYRESMAFPYQLGWAIVFALVSLFLILSRKRKI